MSKNNSSMHTVSINYFYFGNAWIIRSRFEKQSKLLENKIREQDFVANTPFGAAVVLEIGNTNKNYINTYKRPNQIR